MSSDTMIPVRPDVSESRIGLGLQRTAAQRPAAPVELPQAAVVEPTATVETVRTAAKEIDAYLKSSGRELEFSLDEPSGRMVVSVKDTSTGKVLRQIPGEDVLRMARALRESEPSLINLKV